MPPPIASTISNASALADELARFRLVPLDRIARLMAEFPGGGALLLAEFLVTQGQLTPFQAERVLAGQAKSLNVGPYCLLEPHHVGVFGPIFRARRGEVEFAVRVLPLRSLWQAKQAKQLLRTFALLSNVPAVVPLVDADSASGSHYLAWPLTSGELLADRIQNRGPLPMPEVLDLLMRLTSALAACHARQIVHGLMTPLTVCLDERGLPQILEVGAGMLLAQNLASDDSLFDTMSASLAVAGALEFASPEWIASPANPAPAMDQYSIGAIGYHALTGASPALGPRVKSQTVLPAELGPIIERMLQADPAARFLDLDAARAALAAVARPTPTEAPKSQPPISKAAERIEPLNGEPVKQVPLPELRLPPIEPIREPVARDDSAGSIHFDLPEALEYESPVGMFGPHAARETPPPAPRITAKFRAPETPPTVKPRSKVLEPAPPSTVKPRSKVLEPAPPSTVKPRSKVLEPVPTPPPEEDDDPPPSELSNASPPPMLLPATPLAHGRQDAATARPASKYVTGGGTPKLGFWQRLKQRICFWKTFGDKVQVSVFGPAHVAHSESPRLTVFLHAPAVAASVATLARAFHHDSVLLGSSLLTHPVTRGTPLDVHVALTYTPVANPLGGLSWQGQPQRLTYDFVVPWEAPIGATKGVVSVGRREVRIGKVEFRLTIRGRNG